MKPEWKEFLIENGAEFDGDVLASFGNPERERRIAPQGNILCDLSHIGLISVRGDDAASFLQNQFSNDINEVDLTHSQLSSYCNHKGRVIANFRIMKRDDVYYIRLSRDLLEVVIQQLRKYVMISKVELDDATSGLIHFGYTGPQADKTLSKVIGLVPDQPNTVISYRSLTVARLPGNELRYEIIGDLEDAKSVWESLNVRAAPVGSDSWKYLNILAGIPVVTAESSEAWVPQMLNYELIGGVSFSKGCYPGQEVVARLNYLGKTKRRTYRLQIRGDELPVVGSKVMSSTGEAGRVLNAVFSPDGDVEVLAVLKNKDAEHELTINGVLAVVHPLPYDLGEAS